MKVFAFYDIVENKTRTKLIDLLEEFGFIRVQNSVFLGEISNRNMRRITEISSEIINLDADSLYFFPVCEKDFNHSIFLTRSNSHKIFEKEIMFF